MGIVTPGPPRDIVSDLARRNGATVFVETGVYWLDGHWSGGETAGRR